ncbi:hypothetical protein V3W47_18995 [Deinococcus sp. YIM 134068]|uniref:hypothetical protein n=1 Tax=Deinococcus lichenicola TaxID=3118910 RepID=UPI002F92D52A
MNKSQLISPPDGNVLETLTDPRVLATAGGVAAYAYGEKALYKSARNLFGIASAGEGGKVVYYAVKADGTADTSATAPQFGTNRNVARAVGIVGSVALIEYSNSAPMQYALLGGASVLLTHMLQDVIPGLR